MNLIYSEESLHDLKRLREFIARNNPAAAQRTARELVERMDYLSQFPGIGNSVSLAPKEMEIRDMVFGNYIVRYMVQPTAIIVLRIWHHYENRE